MLESKALSVWSLAPLLSAWATQVGIMSKTENEKEKQERGYGGSLLETSGFTCWKWMFSALFWMIEHPTCLFLKAQHICHKIKCNPDVRALSHDFSFTPHSQTGCTTESYPDGRRGRPQFLWLWTPCVSDQIGGRGKMQLLCQLMHRIRMRRALQQLFIEHAAPVPTTPIRALLWILSMVQGWVNFTLKALRLVPGICDYICNSS